MVSAKRKAFLFLTIAFILAIITGWFISNQVTLAKESIGETVQVAVAKEELAAYTEIKPSMVDWISIPKSSAVSSFITNERELENHLLIVNLKEGDLITSNIIRSQVDIPEGYRVVWLNPTTNVILDQDIYVGDKVDIIASFNPSRDSEIETKRIMENIDVIQTDHSVVNENGNHSIKVSITVEQAEQLIHMQNTAHQIRVLRINQLQVNGEEEGDETEEEVTVEPGPEPDPNPESEQPAVPEQPDPAGGEQAEQLDVEETEDGSAE